MDSSKALEKLKSGNERFLANKNAGDINYTTQRADLVSGQAPFATILSCSDSRVPPEIIFDANLGEVFIIRVAGNIANTDAIASIEYAVKYLKCPLVVVMGHQSCGAVTAATSDDDFGDNLNHLLAQIKPVLEKTDGDDLTNYIKENARSAAEDLSVKSPIIDSALKNNEIEVLSAHYNLDSGKVDFLN